MESALHLDKYKAGVKGSGTGYKYFVPEKVLVASGYGMTLP